MHFELNHGHYYLQERNANGRRKFALNEFALLLGLQRVMMMVQHNLKVFRRRFSFEISLTIFFLQKTFDTYD